jgi:hypothetical protein
MVNVEAIIWYLFLLDSLGASLFAWFMPKWSKKKFPKLTKHLPLTKAWATIYLVLVLWVGSALHRMNVLPY